MSLIAQIMFSFIIIVPIAIIALAVTRDAAKKGFSGWGTLGWVIVSLCFFPIGLLLYFLINRQSR